jgi:hypothetical protein
MTVDGKRSGCEETRLRGSALAQASVELTAGRDGCLRIHRNVARSGRKFLGENYFCSAHHRIDPRARTEDELQVEHATIANDKISLRRHSSYLSTL